MSSDRVSTEGDLPAAVRQIRSNHPPRFWYKLFGRSVVSWIEHATDVRFHTEVGYLGASISLDKMRPVSRVRRSRDQHYGTIRTFCFLNCLC